jgi:hypothetical protein
LGSEKLFHLGWGGEPRIAHYSRVVKGEPIARKDLLALLRASAAGGIAVQAIQITQVQYKQFLAEKTPPG